MAYAKEEAWWDATLNVFAGCSAASPGCKNCYAAYEAGTRQTRHRIGLYESSVDWIRGKPVFNGSLSVLPPHHPAWRTPLVWKGAPRPVMGVGQPSLIFVGDMSDIFHEERPEWVVDEVVATLAASRHIGLLLTKRTERMTEYFGRPRPLLSRLQNRLWLGFSAENQQWFDERWEHMRRLAQQGWVVFVSAAPLLAPLHLPTDFLLFGRRAWVIASGEQKVGNSIVRPMDPSWARAVRDQCAAADVPFFLLQMSRREPIPPDLLVRQFPAATA